MVKQEYSDFDCNLYRRNRSGLQVFERDDQMANALLRKSVKIAWTKPIIRKLEGLELERARQRLVSKFDQSKPEQE